MSFEELPVEIVQSEMMPEEWKHYANAANGFVKVGEKKWFLPYKYRVDGDKIYTFETRPDDTWIVTFPRSGTTLTQEIIWLVANNLNLDEAHRTTLTDRFPFIDVSILAGDHTFPNNEKDKKSINYFEFIQEKPSPRFIKSHLPFDLLPTVVNSDCKIIYVARNPKDVVVSWYHFQKNHQKMHFQGTFEQFCDCFMANETIFSPYWEHVKGAWTENCHRPNTLFLFYEDLRKDLPANVKKIAEFFGKTYSDEQIAKLTEHLSIESFRKNPMINNGAKNNMKPDEFIRQGKVGGWKEMFMPEIEEKFDKWVTDNLKDTDLSFPN